LNFQEANIREVDDFRGTFVLFEYGLPAISSPIYCAIVNIPYYIRTVKHSKIGLCTNTDTWHDYRQASDQT